MQPEHSTFSADRHTHTSILNLVRHKGAFGGVWIDSRIFTALIWIEFDKAEMRRLNRALQYSSLNAGAVSNFM